ncbi:MAG: hypothetical protein ACRDGV_04430 [Candidatus Limnocylindria bacterium]
MPHRLANVGDTPVHAIWFVLGRDPHDQPRWPFQHTSGQFGLITLPAADRRLTAHGRGRPGSPRP